MFEEYSQCQIAVVVYIKKWEDCLTVMSVENINFHQWFELNITTERGFCRESQKERPGGKELKAFKGISVQGFKDEGVLDNDRIQDMTSG